MPILSEASRQGHAACSVTTGRRGLISGVHVCMQAFQQQQPLAGSQPAIQEVKPAPSKRDSYYASPYGPLFSPRREVKPFVQLDHVKRRREREVEEIVQAARRHGLSKQQVEDNITRLESLLPDLAPNLDRMRASDWAVLVKDVDRVAVMLVTLKSCYPGANLSRIISKRPKLLLQDPKLLQQDAQQVRALLGDKLPNLDTVIEECPDLMRPAQAALSVNNLKRWFPSQDPYELLQKNPALLNNIEEADLQPDPTYGWESNYGWLAERAIEQHS